MEVYAGIDLHASNSFLAVVDREGKTVFKRRLLNDSAIVLSVLEPYRECMQGIAVESTFNWYWLVDALMDAGYRVHLGKSCRYPEVPGIKHSDDTSDAVGWQKCCAWAFCRKDISIHGRATGQGPAAGRGCTW